MLSQDLCEKNNDILIIHQIQFSEFRKDDNSTYLSKTLHNSNQK